MVLGGVKLAHGELLVGDCFVKGLLLLEVKALEVCLVLSLLKKDCFLALNLCL